MEKKLSGSTKKFIRFEKARIRKQFYDVKNKKKLLITYIKSCQPKKI